jgi:hypothetical protein
MFKISISKNAPEQTSLELLPEIGLAAQGSRSVPVADIFDRSNDRALLRTRAVLSPEEAIVEIARRSPANVREQLCRMVSDLGYPSLSVREAQRFLEGILQPELLDSFIVDGNALIHAVRSDPESFQVKIATEMRASHLSDEESGRVASQRPSDRISDFLTRKVLVPLVDKGLRTLKARTKCSRLPCIITLGIERGDHLLLSS